jgi:hypothetical protein
VGARKCREDIQRLNFHEFEVRLGLPAYSGRSEFLAILSGEAAVLGEDGVSFLTIL